ncbi:alpha/beta hydrolase [Cerasicoccus frondis]|uniref:alpha/beta hydrolase n=1 Tax=Cerasicoccus frondis TaxID=490090 RepID=UPI002852ACB8|nr:alpha/beta hydrolase family protein [Cerasicoccus frondis]
MAFIQCDFFSEVLGFSTSMNVILPQATSGQIGMTGAVGEGRHKTLWLLHGRSDDHTIWMRRTSIERYVSNLGLAVIMPQANLSFYNNISGGSRYGDFFEHELPEIARSFFPLSSKREDNYVAGLSMGGYGAMKLALTNPERYCAAASLSGALDVIAMGDMAEPARREFMRFVFGDQATKLGGTRADLFHLLAEAKANNVALPTLFACCGRQDFLIEHNRNFVAKCEELDIPLNYVENGGTHEWGYWDKMIQEVLEWLPGIKG